MKLLVCSNDDLSRWRGYLKIGCVAGLSSWILQVDAAEWNIQPRLRASETYTDNVSLGGGSGGEFITQINPGVDITGEGRRFKSNLNYTLNNLIFAKNERLQTRSLLAANATAEIIKQHFFVDGRAAISQQNAFLFAPLALDNANLTGNRRNVYTWNISPYVRQRFSNLASGEVRYRHGEVSSSGNSFANNSSDTAILSLNSGSAFRTLGWGVNYSHTEIRRKLTGSSFGPLRTISLERAAGSLRYLVSSQFSLIGTAGYERNSFLSIRGRTSSPFWTVGFSWAPTKRTKVDLSGGKRFFGNTYAAAVDHRTRSTVWNLSYVEDISTFGQQSQAGGSILDASMLGQLFSGVQGGEALLSQGFPLSFSDPNNFLTNRLFLLKRLQASLTLNGKKNSLVFRAFNYSRKSFSPDQEDADLIGIGNAALTRNTTQTGGNVLWSHRLSPRANANINFGYIGTSYDLTSQKDDNIIMSAGLSKQFSSKINGSLTYRHLRRESNRNNGSYSSNALIAMMSMNF